MFKKIFKESQRLDKQILPRGERRNCGLIDEVRNVYYDGVTQDIVDETIKNIQNYNQRLYTNESNIDDEITHRIENLKATKEIEENSYYGTDKVNYDVDNYDNDGYEDLFKIEGEEEFEEDIGELNV